MTDLLICLKHIKEHGPMDRAEGICGNVLLAADELGRRMVHDWLMEGLEKMLVSWPENAGDCQMMKVSYPVEGNRDYWVHARSRTLWDNPRRHALLDWLIKELS